MFNSPVCQRSRLNFFPFHTINYIWFINVPEGLQFWYHSVLGEILHIWSWNICYNPSKLGWLLHKSWKWFPPGNTSTWQTVALAFENDKELCLTEHYIYLYITKTLIMYVCMYVCSRNTAKTVHDSAKIFSPPYSSFSYGVRYEVSFKSGNEKII